MRTLPDGAGGFTAATGDELMYASKSGIAPSLLELDISDSDLVKGGMELDAAMAEMNNAPIISLSGNH